MTLSIASDVQPHPRTVMLVTWSLVAGGSETYALTIARGLDPENYRAAFCAVDKGGPLESEVRQLGFPCTIMHRRNGIDLGLIWRMYRLFRETGVDVVHTHHFNQLFYSVLGAKLVGAKIIHTEHSIECYKKRRLRVAMRMLSWLCDKVTAIGPDGAAVLLDRVKVPKNKLEIIRAGVNLDAFTIDKAEARRLLALEQTDHVAVIIARLFPEKNHRLLLNAFSRVVEKVPDARLLIAGDGTEREAIVGEIERLGLGDHVRMLGVRRDVPVLLAASDLFALSSDREGLPIAVLEAMAARRPVLATRVGDVPEVVGDGVAGRLVPAKDAESLAAGMVELFTNPELAAEMGQRGRQYVEKHYAVRNMIARHEAIYGTNG